MAEPIKRSSFLESMLDDMKDDIRRGGAVKLIPWTLIICLIFGFIIASAIPKERFYDKPEISMVFFAAAVTINGLLLTLSWGSFAKIYELASKPAMASFLRRHNILNSYIFHVDYIHYAQIFSLSCSCIALILAVFDTMPDYITNIISVVTIQRISMTMCLASTVYALSYALGSVRMMQDLVWYSAEMPDSVGDKDWIVHPGGGSRRD